MALGKPVQWTDDQARWRLIAVREAQAAERRLQDAEARIQEARRVLAEAQASYEVEFACAVAARAWRDRVETAAPQPLTPTLRAA